MDSIFKYQLKGEFLNMKLSTYIVKWAREHKITGQKYKANDRFAFVEALYTNLPELRGRLSVLHEDACFQLYLSEFEKNVA